MSASVGDMFESLKNTISIKIFFLLITCDAGIVQDTVPIKISVSSFR